MKNIQDIFCMTPEDFFRYIKTIRYGYRDTEGKVHVMSVGDNYDDTEDKGVYVFSSPEEVVKNNCGWCWDVANLIKVYCDGNHIENKCVFLEYRSPELHQTHTQVFVSYNGKWCEAPDNSSPLSLGDNAYEEADVCIRSFAEMFTDYLKSVLGDKYDKTCLMIREFDREIPDGISSEEYLGLVRGSHTV